MENRLLLAAIACLGIGLPACNSSRDDSAQDDTQDQKTPKVETGGGGGESKAEPELEEAKEKVEIGENFAQFLEHETVNPDGSGVLFEHAQFPNPIQFKRTTVGLDPVDPLGINLEGAKILLDESPIDLAECQKRLKEYVALVEQVGERPLVMLTSSEDTTLERGIEVLGAISAAGIDEVVISSPGDVPSVPSSPAYKAEFIQPMQKKPAAKRQPKP